MHNTDSRHKKFKLVSGVLATAMLATTTVYAAEPLYQGQNNSITNNDPSAEIRVWGSDNTDISENAGKITIIGSTNEEIFKTWQIRRLSSLEIIIIHLAKMLVTSMLTVMLMVKLLAT